MDAKARKKILNCLKKDGGEQEVFDIAVAVKIDEDAVQAELEEMSKDGLAASRLNEKGVALWKAAEDAAPAAKPAKKPAAEADIADFEPGPAAPAPAKNAAEDVFDLESAIHQAAPPPPAPPPIQAPRPPVPPKAPPAPAPASAPTAAFDLDDFEPRPKKEKAVREPKAPKPDTDDFEPKPKKEKKVREKPDDAGDALDDDPPPVIRSAKLPMPALAGAAAAVLIIVLIIVAVSGGGKAKAAAEAARAEFKTELQAYKDEADGKIAKLEERQKALEAKVDGLKKELDRRRDAAQATKQAGTKKKK